VRSAQARCLHDPRLSGLRPRRWRVLSGRLIGTFCAGTRSPVNFSRHSRPEPKPLLTAPCAAVIRLLPCSGVGCLSLIRDQADSLVLDGGETRLSSGPWTTRQQGSDGSDQALHDSQYEQMMGRVNERLRRSKWQRQCPQTVTTRDVTLPLGHRMRIISDRERPIGIEVTPPRSTKISPD
jgi:hypothetical protein